MFSQAYNDRMSAKVKKMLESGEYRDELRKRIRDGEYAKSMLEWIDKNFPEKDLTTAVADA